MYTDNVLISNWGFDNILLKDVSPESWQYSPERNDNGETDIDNFEDNNKHRFINFHDYCNPSSGTSIASSEGSDDIYCDLESEADLDLFGDLASSVLNLIQDIKETEDTEPSEYAIDYSPCDNCDRLSAQTCTSNTPDQPTKSIHQTVSSTTSKSEETYSIDTSCTSCSNYSKNGRSRKQRDKKWNELNEEEKVTVVDQLSQRISRDLGLREQIEVIRMIDPKSQVSPTDKQFLIDITHMTEEKIQKIQDYIKTHCCLECQSDDNGIVTTPRKSKKRQLSQERKNRHKNDRQRQRKEYRQILKERRSGLFVKEEILSISRLTPPPEDEELDVLE